MLAVPSFRVLHCKGQSLKLTDSYFGHPAYLQPRSCEFLVFRRFRNSAFKMLGAQDSKLTNSPTVGPKQSFLTIFKSPTSPMMQAITSVFTSPMHLVAFLKTLSRSSVAIG
jgi:hypothetical protein